MPFFSRKKDKQQASTKSPKEPVNLKRTPSTRSNPQSPDSANGDIGIPSGGLQPPKPPKLVLSEADLQSLDTQSDQTGASPNSPMSTSSRLSKTLQEILHDKDAVHCFIHYMQSQKADRFIRFWLDANSFHAATLTRMRSHSLKSVGDSSLLQRRSQAKESEKGDDDDSGEACDENSRVGGEGEEYSEREGGKNSCATSDGGYAESDATEPNVREACDNQDRQPVTSQLKNNAKTDRLDNESVISSSHPPGKPNSLPIPQVNIHITSAAGEKSSTPSPVMLNLVSPQSTESSLQDSGIANSDGESVVTPSSRGDSESVDTLVDDDRTLPASATNCSGQGQQIASSFNADDSHGTRQGQVTATSESGEDSVQGEAVIRGSDSQSAEEEAAAKSSRSMSAEEMREKLKKSIERDAVSIFTKYIAQDAEQPIGVDDQLRGETIRKICREDKQVDPDCFVGCQEFVVKLMEKQYHQPFLDSEFHCQHQVHVLTSSQVYLADIIYNEHALCYFMEFMEQEGAQHLMQFWIAADNFQQQLILEQQEKGGYDGMQAQADAMVLYDKFFSLQATVPLGFDDTIRFEVESNICREAGPLPDCFAKPRDLVLHTLEKVHFSRYLSSDIYYRYLSDLINTVQMAQDLPQKRQHKRQASDASSEHSGGSHSVGGESISTRNTLLAAASRAKITTSTSMPGMKISEEPLGDMETDYLHGEDLWKQPNKAPLRLGSVNSLGQFVSEFEIDPDGGKKKSGGGGLFFKKNKHKEKEQEELAIKVAQMIISDVANMTKMGDAATAHDNSNNNSSDRAGVKRSSSMSSSLSMSAPFNASSFFEPPPS